MKNFNWESFTKKIAIKADITDLYNAWTIPLEIEKWFLSKAIFNTPDGEHVLQTKNIEQNQSYQWSWWLHDIIETGKIVQANGKDHLQFTFAGNCLVDVKFTQFNDYVIIALTQSNIPTDSHSKRNIRLGCESGWSFYLLNMKAIYEGGNDLRNKDIALKGMLND